MWHYVKSDFVSQEFDDYRDADDAVYELNGKELMGERLYSNFILHFYVLQRGRVGEKIYSMLGEQSLCR